MRVLILLLFLTISSGMCLELNASNLFHRTDDTTHFYAKHSYDVLKYNMTVGLYQCFDSPYPKSFSARLIITLKVDSILNLIKLNAINSSLEVDSVNLAGISFNHQYDTLNIFLDRVYQPGEILDIQIYYRHKNVNDHGFYAYYGTLFTDSPPEGARKWMPCWDRPSDKATWELTASVKSPAQLGSNGLMVEPATANGDTITYHWVSKIPISTYLITFSSKINFETWQKYYPKLTSPSDSIPILIYHKPGENVLLIDSTIIPMTDFFASKFGEYPFEKIGFATLNTQFTWAGMENQSLVHLRPNGYADLNLIAHEHSHQWFGDMITCGTWADIWLNEGFGTYCQNLWVEFHDGYDTYMTSMKDLANYYLAVNPGWPLYQPEWAVHTPVSDNLYNQAISYNKGACVLFQLRYVIGDSLFFKALHDYATDTNLMFKNAVTEDFINVVNKVAGKDLTWFFDQWVYGPNHPEYANTFQIDSLDADSWKAILIINQTQTNAGFFKMPVQLLINFIDGTDSLVTVFNDENHQAFAFSFSKRPANLTFDPNRKILLKKAATIYNIGNHNGSLSFILHQNEPNPFHTFTSVTYEVPKEANIKISVVDSNGKLLSCPVNNMHTPGLYRFSYENPGLSAGVYYLQMESGNIKDTKRMIVVN